MIVTAMVLAMAAQASSAPFTSPVGCPPGAPTLLIRRPTTVEVDRVAPRGRLKGHIVVRCGIGADNRTRNCTVIEVSGARGGTELAALRLSADLELHAPKCAVNPSLEGKTVTVPWNF